MYPAQLASTGGVEIRASTHLRHNCTHELHLGPLTRTGRSKIRKGFKRTYSCTAIRVRPSHEVGSLQSSPAHIARLESRLPLRSWLSQQLHHSSTWVCSTSIFFKTLQRMRQVMRMFTLTFCVPGMTRKSSPWARIHAKVTFPGMALYLSQCGIQRPKCSENSPVSIWT